MGLREDALEAAEAAKTQRETTARAILADRLQPSPVAALTVADTRPECIVFADTTAGLFLAVRDQAQPPRVTRVVGQAGNWTARGEVDSLATLGLIIAAEAEA